MIQLLKAQDHLVMPWKNGLGITSQIDIFPSGASFPDQFLWRVSSAQVKTSAPFSQFIGCDRYLAVLEGAGLQLNQTRLEPHQIIHFAGEEQIHGALLAGPVLDLGVIYNREHVRASMAFKSVVAGQTLDLVLDHEVNYLFCARGAFQAQNEKLQVGDCLKVQDHHNLRLASDPDQNLEIFLIQLSRQ